jgi:Tfp pilus assembly protein PilN
MKPVNLIPQDQRRRTPREGDGKPSYILLGVLGVVLVMVLGYVLTTNTVTERKNDTDAARAEADQLEAKANQQAAYTDFEQIASTRAQSVLGVAANRFDWERFMRELSLIMPEGSWLQSADASVTGTQNGSGTPSTSSSSTSGTANSPAATLIGCTPHQSDVARMMVRMEQMYRVQDVQLNDSTAGSPAETVSVDSCGHLYTFNLTITFDPNRPAREAPRGSSGVPASLGGGS